MESKISPKYALIKSKSFHNKKPHTPNTAVTVDFEDHMNNKQNMLQSSHKTDENHVIHVIRQSIDNRGKPRSSSQSNMYLEKYGYGQTHNVETQTKRSIQYPNVHKEISMGNRQNEKAVQKKSEERVKTIFKSKLGVEKHMKLKDYPENAQE